MKYFLLRLLFGGRPQIIGKNEAVKRLLAIREVRK
jgi:hypothetical protein